MPFVLYLSAIVAGRCLNAPGFWRRVGTIAGSIEALDVGSATRVPADHERGGVGRLSGTTPEVQRPVSSPYVSGRRLPASAPQAAALDEPLERSLEEVRNAHTVAEFACGTIGGM
jgi:hypothetical protein